MAIKKDKFYKTFNVKKGITRNGDPYITCSIGDAIFDSVEKKYTTSGFFNIFYMGDVDLETGDKIRLVDYTASVKKYNEKLYATLFPTELEVERAGEEPIMVEQDNLGEDLPF